VRPSNCASNRSPILSILASSTGEPSLSLSGTYTSYSRTALDSILGRFARFSTYLGEGDAGRPQGARGVRRHNESPVGQRRAGGMAHEQPPSAGFFLFPNLNDHVHRNSPWHRQIMSCMRFALL